MFENTRRKYERTKAMSHQSNVMQHLTFLSRAVISRQTRSVILQPRQYLAEYNINLRKWCVYFFFTFLCFA
jgi:hypothetical protein